MQPDLEALQRALTMNQQATQGLVGLDERYTRANALRDSPMPEADQYGTVSPLSVLANVMRSGRGNKQLQEIEPQRNKLRSQLAEGTGMIEGAKLGRTIGKYNREGEEHEASLLKKAQDLEFGVTQEERDKRTADLNEDKFTLDKDKFGFNKRKHRDNYGLAKNRANRMAQTQRSNQSKLGDTEVWEDADGNKQVVATDGRGRPVSRDPETGQWAEVDTSRWMPPPDSSGKPFRGKGMSTDNIVKLSERSSRIKRLRELRDTWDDSYAQPTGYKTELAEKVSQILKSNDMWDLIDKEKNPQIKKAAQWWAGWTMDFEVDKIHELFGTHLGRNEEGLWKRGTNMTPAMSADTIRSSIDRLLKTADDKFLGRVNMGDKSKLEETKAYYTEASRGLYDRDPKTGRYGKPSLKEVKKAEKGMGAGEKSAYDKADAKGKIEILQMLEWEKQQKEKKK